MSAGRAASAVVRADGLTYLVVAFLAAYAGWLSPILPVGLPAATARARAP